MFLYPKSAGRSCLYALLACAAAVWIGLTLFLQWLIFMPQSVLAVEVVTKLPMVSLRNILQSQLSMPLGPPPK
jgi:hypothetical protein